jgi:hypothetical protein
VFVAILAWTLRMGVSRLESIDKRQQKFAKDIEEFSNAELHGRAIQNLQSLSEVMGQAGMIHAVSRVFLRMAGKEILEACVPNRFRISLARVIATTSS